MMSKLQVAVAGKLDNVDVEWTEGMECLALSVAHGKLWCRALVCGVAGVKYQVCVCICIMYMMVTISGRG